MHAKSRTLDTLSGSQSPCQHEGIFPRFSGTPQGNTQNFSAPKKWLIHSFIHEAIGEEFFKNWNFEISMIFWFGIRDPILQQKFLLQLQHNALLGEDRKSITSEYGKPPHLWLSTSSTANSDGILKPILSVSGQLGGQETPKSTTFVQKRHHFASKDRNLQRDADTVFREVSFALYTPQTPIRAFPLNLGHHDVKSDRCYRS